MLAKIQQRFDGSNFGTRFAAEADTRHAKANVCFVLKAIITSWTCVNCAHRVVCFVHSDYGGPKPSSEKIKKAIIGKPF